MRLPARFLAPALLAAALSGCSGITIARVSVVEAGTGLPIRHAGVSLACGNWNLDVSGKNTPRESRRDGNTGRDNAVWFATWDNTASAHAWTGYYAGHGGANARRQGLALPLLHLPILFLRLEVPPVRTPVSLLYHKFHSVRKGKPPVSPPPDSSDAAIDLMEGDYLPPWGRGKVADILVTVAPREEWEPRIESGPVVIHIHPDGSSTVVEPDPLTPTLRFTFPGEGNGIRRVEPNRDGGPLVFAAPETGYSPDFGPITSQGGYDGDGTPCYCFRIRSVFDADGRLAGGYYGKIYGPVTPGWVRPATPPLVKLPWFSCYVNPTPLDTNLEPLPPYHSYGP